MSAPTIDLVSLKTLARNYDYIRFTWSCLNGIAKGKTIASKHAIKSYLKDGVGCYAAAIGIGPNNEVPHLPVIEEKNHCNMYTVPAINTIIDLPWVSEDNYRVGQILCEPVWADGKPQLASPRYVARKQLETLSAMGYELYSAAEVECIVMEKDSLKPLFSGNDAFNVFVQNQYEKMLFEFDRMLRICGIDIEVMQSEYSPGQLEFATSPKFGIEMADMVFCLKEYLKELFDGKGYHVTYMTKPFLTSGCGNGGHFNFSLWDKTKKKNLFYDPSKPDNLSQDALYFIGGVLKHARAVTALCNPTGNCYRRLHTIWIPHVSDWGVDNRVTTLRIKNQTENATYIENRIPGGAFNPYLVMAATLAAGIDGLVNKIEPPPQGIRPDSTELPHTLEEALKALNEDTYMVEALGEEFVDWFTQCKQQMDIKLFKDHDVKSNKPEEIEAERLEYFRLM